MKRPIVENLNMSLSKAVKVAGRRGALIGRRGKPSHALMPLDDDMVDFLLERSPKLIKECQEIRERMASGQSHSLAEVEAMLGMTRNRKGSRTVRRKN